MSTKTKSKSKAAEVLLDGKTVTLKQRDAQGKLVDKTFELIPYDDLPRKARRELRNALFKAAPDGSAASDKADIYLSAYDAGLVALRAAGAEIDPNDDSLSTANADALDQLIMMVGLRTLGEMSGGGDPKNAPEEVEASA